MHYISEFSEKQLQDFLVALAFVMNSDGEASQEEQDYIKVAATAYGLENPDLDAIMKERSIDEVKQAISWIKDQPVSARYMIREMISLAISDGNILDEEIDAIFSLGESVGISEERMDNMITWAIEGYEWQIQGFQLVEENE